MYVKIEPTGTLEKKGVVQIRLAFYLDPGDYGYETHHVTVPNMEGQEYKGEMKDGVPVDPKDYQKWIDGLPTVTQNNPFHNHFIQVDENATEKDIMDKAEVLCKEAYEAWKKDQVPMIKNPTVVYPAQVTSQKKAALDSKVTELTSTEIIRTGITAKEELK